MSDLRGYGETGPDPRWPGNARITLSLVLNIEEGAERLIEDGDQCSEHLNKDLVCDPIPGARNLNLELHYEYGCCVSVCRLLDLFRDRGLPVTAFAAGLALELVPEIGHRLLADGQEIAAHGWRWVDHREMPAETEAEHMTRTIEAIEWFTGAPPTGWYTGRVAPRTRKLMMPSGVDAHCRFD
jgi:peptidoglycan/xylan/chitin deacetylase (PgdA/CDA1 family)